MIITIHQPNFFPYYPFFQKMKDSDIFVILKHCQFEKNNFQNRFNIGDKWHTLSTNRGLEPIINKKYVNHVKDWLKIKNNLKEYKEVLDVFDDCITENLSETNSYFHIEKPMYGNAFKEKLSTYDFGLNIYEPFLFKEIPKQYTIDYL